MRDRASSEEDRQILDAASALISEVVLFRVRLDVGELVILERRGSHRV